VKGNYGRWLLRANRQALKGVTMPRKKAGETVPKTTKEKERERERQFKESLPPHLQLTAKERRLARIKYSNSPQQGVKDVYPKDL
jgi:hypothetical protein